MTKELLKGNINTAFKSLSYPDEFLPSVGYLPPVYIDPSTHTTPDDGSDWWYTSDGGGHRYFKYTNHGSCQFAYEACPPVQAIINRMAQCFINGKTWILNKQDKESQSTNANKLRALLENPNPIDTQKQFEAQLYCFVKLFGYSILLFRKPAGFTKNIDATNIWNIPPSWVSVEETNKLFYQTDINGIVKTIKIKYKEAEMEVNVNDIYIIKDFTPSFKSLIIPESRIRSLARPINNIIGAYDSRGSLIFDRGALGILSQDAASGNPMGGTLPMTPDEKTELQRDIRKYGTRHGQYKFIITKAALKWQQIGIPTAQLMLFEEVEADTMAIADTLNFPYRLLANTASNSLGGTDANIFTRNLYQDAIIPESESICEQLSAAFNLDDLENGGTLRIDKDFAHIPVLQDDEVQKATARKTRNEAMILELERDLMKVNRFLVLNGEDPLPNADGDVYWSEYKKARGLDVLPTNQNPNQGNEQRSMKILITLIAILFSLTVTAQRDIDTCGTWIPKDTVISAWRVVDTVLRKDKVRNIPQREWITDEQYIVQWDKAENCDCGCEPRAFYLQEQVDKLTGIRRIRDWTVRYKYTKRVLPEYKRTVDSLRKQ